MKVKFYCGAYNYRAPGFHSGGLAPCDIDAPDCGEEGIIEVDEDEWAEGCVHYICPRCGSELNQVNKDLEMIL